MHTSSEIKETPHYGALARYIAAETSLEDALDAFCEQVESKYLDTKNPEDLEELLWQGWRAVITMAASQPHASGSRQKLVDFMLELQKRPKLVNDGETCAVQGGKVWEDLPVLGMEMREAWNLGTSCSRDEYRNTINLSL